MSSPPGSVWAGILLAAAGAIAFSGKAIIVKLSYRYGVDAVTVIMYRMLFALPLFLVLGWWASRGRPPLAGRDWMVLTGLGLSGYYLASFLDFAGLQYITASLERLILYLNPTVVLVLGVLLFGTRVTWRQWLALAVSYAGVLLVFAHDVSTGGEHVILGAALVFGSAVSYALYLVFSGETVKRLGALRITGIATSIACVLCVLQFFVLRPVSAMAVAPEVIWLAVLNATLCTFVPVVLVMMAVERVGAGVTAQAGMVGPLSTIALGVVLLDEPFTVWSAAGTLLVLTGIGCSHGCVPSTRDDPGRSCTMRRAFRLDELLAERYLRPPASRRPASQNRRGGWHGPSHAPRHAAAADVSSAISGTSAMPVCGSPRPC